MALLMMRLLVGVVGLVVVVVGVAVVEWRVVGGGVDTAVAWPDLGGAARVQGPPDRPIRVGVVVVVVVLRGDASGCVVDGLLPLVLPQPLLGWKMTRVVGPGALLPFSLALEEEEELEWANVWRPSGGLALAVVASPGGDVVMWAWVS